jgi:hypothetical protein
MDLGWKILIPISLAWLLLVGAMQVSKVYGFVLFVVFLIGGSVLYRAVSIGRDNDSDVETITTFTRIKFNDETSIEGSNEGDN